LVEFIFLNATVALY